jgi:DNA processing protein
VPTPSADHESWLRLSLVLGFSNAAFRKLLSAFASPEGVLAADVRALQAVVTHGIAAAIKQGPLPDALQQAQTWLSQAGHCLVTIADPEYPAALLQTADPPLVLYVNGRAELLDKPALAVVGSRNATPQGAAIAEELACALSDAGITIVSGLALGIDAAAHRGGLRGAASSVAIVGTGLDVVYPARNRNLAHELAARGALASEFPLATPPLAANFPRRNRLISGLCRGCLVVEAAEQSGSLITARFANEQGREVFAIPGSIHSPLSKGCHALIKQGAKLVESANDVLEELGLSPAAAPAGPADVADKEENALLLRYLGHAPTALDVLCERTGWPAGKIAGMLLDLELNGRVASMPGGLFQRVK